MQQIGRPVQSISSRVGLTGLDEHARGGRYRLSGMVGATIAPIARGLDGGVARCIRHVTGSSCSMARCTVVIRRYNGRTCAKAGVQT